MTEACERVQLRCSRWQVTTVLMARGFQSVALLSGPDVPEKKHLALKGDGTKDL